MACRWCSPTAATTTAPGWHFPEKLIPLYGDGQDVPDWLYVEDHVDALLRWRPWGERTDKEVVEAICSALDDLLPAGAPHSHGRRYAIDPTWISSEQGLAGVR